MKDSGGDDLNRRIAARVRELRAARGLSLEAVAKKSGVSRSMISVIERGESNPTAVVLEKLAVALGVMLASLFDPAESTRSHEGPLGPLVRREEQPVWKDPASGYLRRTVSPPTAHQGVRIAEVHFPAGARVAFDNASGTAELIVHQQIWLLQGAMVVTLGEEKHRLREGDCLAMRLDRPSMFHNPSRKAARYAVVTTSETTGARR
jgi:transcriptional regulator with XRE-family HTH domain